VSNLFLINPGSGRKKNASGTEKIIRNVYQAANRPVEIRHIDFENLDASLESAVQDGIEKIYLL